MAKPRPSSNRGSVAEKCIGCGACENACVVRDRAAITVTSVGESRSPDNQILLNKTKGKTKDMTVGPRIRLDGNQWHWHSL